MGKVWKHIAIISIVAVFITLAAFLIFYPLPSPPVNQMKLARELLSAAGRNEAEIYSGEFYGQAKTFYDSAMKNWHRENDRFIYSRDFSKVAEFAENSARTANYASENSVMLRSDLQEKITEQIGTLNDLVKKINNQFHSYPLTPDIRDHISKGKMFLKEAETAFRNEQYLEAESKIVESEYLLKTSYAIADKDLRYYFRSYPKWKSWIDSTIAFSRDTFDYSIIVDKFSRKCYVFHNGELTKEFTAELGKNWVGDKRVKGDKATPEGMYKIIRKLDGDSTRYYKALLLNYPNDEDTAKFRMEISNGSLPPTAKIGGLIEIHGNGGKGVDWTEGCIALKDNEMDTIFGYVKPGTPVTIVGSMNNLASVLKKWTKINGK